MKTSYVTLCQCIGWQDISAVCWGVIVLIALYLLLRYVISPLIANCHERVMKNDAHNREKQWADYENTKASTDAELQKQVKGLNTKVSELEENLKIEKFNKELLEKQLKMYRDIFEELNVEVKPKENK